MIGIVAMSLLVSDLDHPYHGFFCVRLHNVVTVIKLLDATCVRHSAEAFGKHEGTILASVEPPTAEGAAAVADVEGRLRVTSFRVRPRQCVFLIELNNNCFALAGQEV